MSLKVVSKAYKFKTATDDDVFIGDPADAAFHPKFMLNRWNGECWLKLDFDDSQIAENQRNVNLVENKVNWLSPLFDFQFYPLTATGQHENGGLEFNIILKAKPQQNTIRFPIQTRGFKFYRQRPLTEEFNPADCAELSETYARLKNGMEWRRPENVVNSYAVYHESKRDNHYKAGKAFHIYRPKLTDAGDLNAWADLNVDELSGELVIILPQVFLDSARYPVGVDPTFGYTSVGATDVYNDPNYVFASKFTMPEAGTGASITWYAAGYQGYNNVHCKLAAYRDSDKGKVQETQETTLQQTQDGWVTLNFVSQPALTSQVYWLGNIHDSVMGSKGDTGGTNQFMYDWQGSYAFPATLTPDVYENMIMSIYATYSTGATLKTVTDALSLGDAVLRNKTLMLNDSLGLAELIHGNKSLLLGDATSLSDLITVIINQAIKQISDSVNTADIAAVLKTLKATDMVTLSDVALTPSRVLQAREAVGLADNSVVNKVLQITETVSLAEIVEVGVGGVKKTRLFLILGDLAVQLTGD